MRNLCHPTNGCTGTCDQGRLCSGSLNATRALFGRAPLHMLDGGHRVSGADSVRIPAPPAEPDPAGLSITPFAIFGAIAGLAAAAACVLALGALN